MSLIARVCLVAAMAVFATVPARGASVVYNINSAQSQLNLTVTGSAFGGALTVTEQNPAAVTKYNGTLVADYDCVPTPGYNISFPGGSAASAINPTILGIPFQYQPKAGGVGGTAPANYGVTLSAPVGIVIPPIDLGGVKLDLGTLQSVDIKMAIRNLTVDVLSTGSTPIGPGGTFAATSTSLGITSGVGDINGSLVFKQPNIVSWAAAALALSTVAGLVPELGLSVSSSLAQLTVSLGVGTQLDLTALAGTSVPNAAATDGTVTFSVPSLSSTLSLPVAFALPSLGDIGIPPEILDLQLSLSGLLKGTGTVPVLIGDANHDGYVDGGDYTLWADNFLGTGKLWGQGDFNGDGTVDGGDYTLWADHYAPAPALAQAVPEPSTFVLSALGLVSVLAIGWRRRRRSA